MVTKKKHASRIKAKAATAIGSCVQQTLFNDQGLVPFSPQTDAIAVEPDKGKHDIGGMRVEVIPVPKNLPRALELVAKHMVLMKRGANQWADCDENTVLSFSLDTSPCAKCSVTFRSTANKGVIRATYSRSDDHLDLSLPCRSSWQNYGLGWLLNRNSCCAREAHNPTPWLGKQCGCK